MNSENMSNFIIAVRGFQNIKREKKEESTKEEKRERIPGCTNAKAKSVYERQMYSGDNNDNIKAKGKLDSDIEALDVDNIPSKGFDL